MEDQLFATPLTNETERKAFLPISLHWRRSATLPRRMATCLSDQKNAMRAAAAAYFPISPRNTPVMAEEPASKPFHVRSTQQTKLSKPPNAPHQIDNFLWRLRVQNITISVGPVALGYAVAPFPQTLDGGTDAPTPPAQTR